MRSDISVPGRKLWRRCRLFPVIRPDQQALLHDGESFDECRHGSDL